MNQKYFNLAVAILITIIISSCTSTKKVQEHLEYNKQSIIYLMDSSPSEKVSNHKLSVTAITTDSSVRKEGNVIKETGWVVPLLVVNIWGSQKMCYQGASMFDNDWSTSLELNFYRESQRSGIFKIDSNAIEYQLELTIDKLEAKGPYFSQGHFIFAALFYFYSSVDYAGPAETKLAISYKLKQNGKVVHKNSFNSEKETEQLEKGYKNKKKLIQGFATSMAEATSNNFKNVIESIVQDLNSYFESKAK